MGDIQLVRELRDRRELVFAYLTDGTLVWGLDRASGNQWWYASEHAADVRPQLESALARLDALPLHDSQLLRADATPTSDCPAVRLSPARRGDLAQHEPGHAVLAEIERKHAKATASTVAGMPGVLDEDIVQWCVGYVGEATVGSDLARLGPGWLLLHGVPVGDRGSDIDHVVIGPPGVFTINTKRHPGGNVDVKGTAVFVGGSYQHYIRNAGLDAKRAEAAVSQAGITARVRPIVCVVGARLRIKQDPENVQVLVVEDLVRWLQSQPAALSEQQVGRLYDQLRWASSWSSHPPPTAAAPWVAQFAYQLS
ncbi:MAG TPA: nuclease-related domain-containing protein, partial [Candidatus Nanopelagicales bacterium]